MGNNNLRVAEFQTTSPLPSTSSILFGSALQQPASSTPSASAALLASICK
ncbi:hypothetical protein IG631_15324 [Alternaria alternata]|nr:hypothetical protein IG631_15324 [Alternaria alternata]